MGMVSEAMSSYWQTLVRVTNERKQPQSWWIMAEVTFFFLFIQPEVSVGLPDRMYQAVVKCADTAVANSPQGHKEPIKLRLRDSMRLRGAVKGTGVSRVS